MSSYFNWRQKFLLCFGVPLILLGSIELLCRVIDLPKYFAKNKPNLQLEMPTWMDRDENTRARLATQSVSPAELDWLSLFEEGPNYRVRLIPNIRRKVQNTFSRLAVDRVYTIEANALGFRGPAPARTKPANGLRVLVFGDSSSFGWGVDNVAAFSELLQIELGKRIPGRPIEIGNFAMPGDSSEYGRLIFDNFAPQYPADVYILGFGANDAKTVYTSHTDQVERFMSQNFLLKLRQILSSSYIMKTLEALTTRLPKTAADNSRPRVPGVAPERYAENLSYMAHQAKSKYLGRHVIILNLCTPSHYARLAAKAAHANNVSYLNGQDLLIKSIPQLKSKEIFPLAVADLETRALKELETDELLYVSSDACHPNTIGHAIVADALAKDIVSAITGEK